MNAADDDLWFDALAGRAAATSATTREAQALRAALREGATPRPIAEVRAALPDLAREARLIEKARDDGLIVPAGAPRRSRRWMALAASVLVAMGAILVVQLRQPQESEIVRGIDDGIVRLTAPDPRALKQRILNDLHAAGVDATGYEALGAHGIDADVALPLSDAVKRVLSAYGIPEPKDGSLRIEIRSPP